MSSGNSKLIVGLIIGAAVGAAVGTFLACGKKDEILHDIGEAIDSAKKKISKTINKGIEELDVVVDKANAIAHSAVARAKSSAGESTGEV